MFFFVKRRLLLGKQLFWLYIVHAISVFFKLYIQYHSFFVVVIVKQVLFSRYALITSLLMRVDALTRKQHLILHWSSEHFVLCIIRKWNYNRIR